LLVVWSGVGVEGTGMGVRVGVGVRAVERMGVRTGDSRSSKSSFIMSFSMSFSSKRRPPDGPSLSDDKRLDCDGRVVMECCCMNGAY